MLHRHHIVPLYNCTSCSRDKRGRRNHKKGVCSLQVDSNIIIITIEEHAELHKQLWLMERNPKDELAYIRLSGQINNEEAYRVAHLIGNSKPKSPESNKKRSLTLLGKKRPDVTMRLKGKKRPKQSLIMKGRTPWNKGIPQTEECKKKQSISGKGIVKPGTSKAMMGNQLRKGKAPWNKGLKIIKGN